MGPERVPRKEGEKAHKTRPHYALPTGSTDLRYSNTFFFGGFPQPWPPNPLNRQREGIWEWVLECPCLGSGSLSSRFKLEVKVLSENFPSLGGTN